MYVPDLSISRPVARQVWHFVDLKFNVLCKTKFINYTQSFWRIRYVINDYVQKNILNIYVILSESLRLFESNDLLLSSNLN